MRSTPNLINLLNDITRDSSISGSSDELISEFIRSFAEESLENRADVILNLNAIQGDRLNQYARRKLSTTSSSDVNSEDAMSLIALLLAASHISDGELYLSLQVFTDATRRRGENLLQQISPLSRTIPPELLVRVLNGYRIATHFPKLVSIADVFVQGSLAEVIKSGLPVYCPSEFEKEDPAVSGIRDQLVNAGFDLVGSYLYSKSGLNPEILAGAKRAEQSSKGHDRTGSGLGLPEVKNYLPSKIPSEMDDTFSAIVRSYIDLSDEAKIEIAKNITPGEIFKLLSFSERMASLAVRRSSSADLALGLVALGIDDWSYDSRENLLVLSLHYDASIRIGCDPNMIFAEAAKKVPKRARDGILGYLLREEGQRKIAVMGYQEGTDEDGFRYIRNW